MAVDKESLWQNRWFSGLRSAGPFRPMKRWQVIAVGLLVMVLIPVWGAYGALTGGGGEHGGHGGMEMDADMHMAKSLAYMEEHRLEDGSVEAVPGEPIPITAAQFIFLPQVLRMRTGEEYTLQFMSKDVIHGFSLQMGSSMNAQLMPDMMTTMEVVPTKPGEYLFLCNEYCGLGHQGMYGKIIVEGEAISRDEMEVGAEHEEQDEGMEMEDAEHDE
ncbi:MAG: hypothetical protein V3U26_05690 [Dehalococcoidia bacterium]